MIIKSIPMPWRSKEDAKDYRYFPDPDLPPVYIDEAWLTRTKESLPEMQEEKADRYVESFGLTRDDAQLLTDSRNIAVIFEKTVENRYTYRRTGLPGKPSVWPGMG